MESVLLLFSSGPEVGCLQFASSGKIAKRTILLQCAAMVRGYSEN
jgi:hypothetical protein